MGRERMLAMLLAGLLVAMVPSAFANPSDVTLDASLVEAPEKGWYAAGEIVEISAILSNGGDSVSIDVDPSCNEVLKIWSNGLIIVDGSESCLGQSRGLDLDAASAVTLDSLYWDLTDSNGQLVPSGDYTIEYFIAGEELSSMVNVHVQTPVVAPEGLDLELVVTARDGIHAEASPSIITVRLHNNLNEEMALDFGDCKLVVNSRLIESCGPNSLSANEVVTIAQISVMLETGENTISASLGDGVLSKEFILNAVDDLDQAVSVGNLEDFTLSIVLEDDSFFGGLDLFESDISLSNQGEADISLDFTTSCRGEIWIVNSAGEVVMDSRTQKDCTELEVQNLISPGGERSFSQPSWAFIGPDGCTVAPGNLMVVMEIPEHDLFETTSISLSRGSSSNCESETMQITAELSGEEILVVNPQIVSTVEDEITWLSACGLETKLVGPDGEIEMILSQCDDENITKRFTTLTLNALEFDMIDLEEGEYSLYFVSISDPLVQSLMVFDWPIVDEEIISNGDSEEDDEAIVSRVVEGTWSSTNTEEGTCWLLNSPEEGIITLVSAPGLVSWFPEIGATGEYLVHESEAAPQCSDFVATAIVVEEVYNQESGLASEETQQDSNAPPAIEAQENEISPVVVTVGVVVASGGLISLLVGLIATNESWRIPTTSAGLWLLGLVGRTSETSDGRYQRGRLMGYLTANPGCHFRALMAALEMSNGQITHHLKVLEEDGGIWRRPDGRLVRFYPFTSNLHPGIIEGELPLPPLSPDPNSLQGKILRLLDNDGNMKKYPTQSELAHRLDRSQQLVSHHLRTLQKFGLVEKRKNGVRNRYSLTREAVFLLDTTEV
ncbi:MAG: ArsR family transcriptional regulator [Candidatus Poseidoniales archaeon]